MISFSVILADEKRILQIRILFFRNNLGNLSDIQ